MCARAALGLAVVLIVSILNIAPGFAEFRICNKSSESVSVAISFDAGRRSGWISEGWWVIQSGRCETVHGNRFNNQLFYYYAMGERGSVWSGESDTRGVQFCADPTQAYRLPQAKFRYRNDEDCKKHKLEAIWFVEADVGDADSFVQDLIDALPPTPQPTPQPGPRPDVPKGPAPAPSPPPSGGGTSCERFPNLC